jgi:hypothetical protein
MRDPLLARDARCFLLDSGGCELSILLSPFDRPHAAYPSTDATSTYLNGCLSAWTRPGWRLAKHRCRREDYRVRSTRSALRFPICSHLEACFSFPYSFWALLVPFRHPGVNRSSNPRNSRLAFSPVSLILSFYIQPAP